MEDAICALRERDGEIVLPSMRPPARDATRVTISIAWNAASRRFVIITTTDHGAERIDRLLASERREKLLLQRQAEAARARLRVAHDLHDTLARSIVTLILDMGLVAKTTRDEEARAKLIELQAEARGAITRPRDARRDEDDPKRIVEAFAKRALDKGPLEPRAEFPLDISALPLETAEALSRILREALRNIEPHACARCVDIHMRVQDGAVHLDISDEGVGFDPARTAAGHFGLVGMKERAAGSQSNDFGS